MSIPSVSSFRAKFGDRVIVPGDPGYEQARVLFDGGFDHHPEVIVRPADPADVASVVAIASEHGLPLAVRSGGHSAAGHSVSDGGITLDLAAMKKLDIDRNAREAWAQTGLTAGEYTSAAAEHGLATGFGDTGSVGIGGITLGGGVGFLSRKHGLTIDSLLAAELVTADGSIVQASATQNPDLFWAVRGGGGNFGVATKFKFRLHDVPQIVGGLLVLPATADVIAGFVAEAEAAPDELSTIAAVMPAPPLPFLPADTHGSMVVMAQLCYAGEADEAQRVLAPFRALATPLADMVRPMPYPGMFTPQDPDYHPTMVTRNMYVNQVDRDVAETILEHLRAPDVPMRIAQLRVLGGAIARVPADATAYAHRASRIMVNVVASYAGPDSKSISTEWAEKFAAALHQGDDGVYVNFLGDEGEARLRKAYPGATWDRLVAAKRRYDPGNMFGLNQNIPAGDRR